MAQKVDITVDNYFEKSAGEFTSIAHVLTKKIITHGQEKQNFTHNGQSFIFNFASCNERYNSCSYYYVVDNKVLYRASDHWSELIANNECIKLVGIRSCGNIRYCYWTLKLVLKEDAFTYEKVSFLGGCCSFNNMDEA